ncbi:hypothetical protein G6F43_013704 [Rhizopus delemar]|nr:hypothetical protein G6F43_013704 [Rhizopus delemar]
MEWYQQLNETSKSRHANLHGTKYSELLRLRYFDPVMFTVVDPMHNLYLGTAKKMMMIWRTTMKNRRLMLTNEDMKTMVAEARNIQLPVGYDSSSLIRKMTTGEIGFSHLKADEWKVWVTSMSKVLLLGKLDRQYYQHWLKFVWKNKNKFNPKKAKKETTRKEQKARAALSLRNNEASSGDLYLLLYIFFH